MGRNPYFAHKMSGFVLQSGYFLDVYYLVRAKGWLLGRLKAARIGKYDSLKLN